MNADQLPLATTTAACQQADGAEIHYGTFHVLPVLPFRYSLQGPLSTAIQVSENAVGKAGSGSFGYLVSFTLKESDVLIDLKVWFLHQKHAVVQHDLMAATTVIL